MTSSYRVWVAVLSVFAVLSSAGPLATPAQAADPIRLVRIRSNTTAGHYFDLMATLASGRLRELKLRELSRARGGAETVHAENAVATLGTRAAALEATLMEGPYGVDVASLHSASFNPSSGGEVRLKILRYGTGLTDLDYRALPLRMAKSGANWVIRTRGDAPTTFDEIYVTGRFESESRGGRTVRIVTGTSLIMLRAAGRVLTTVRVDDLERWTE